MYAEAKIELNEIDATVIDAMNSVRARAYGVDKAQTTSYPAFTILSQTDMRKQLRMERRMELAGENLRFADLIRWRLAEVVMKQKQYGMLYPATECLTKVVNTGNWFWPITPDIDENGCPDFTKMEATGLIQVLSQRQWDNRQYLWPIPSKDIQIVKLEEGHYKFTLLSTVAGLFGVLASVLSFARGGWVGIPLIFFVVLYIYKNRISKKLVGVIGLSIFMGGVLLSNNAQFMDRVLSVKSALTSYSNGVKDGSIGARLDMWKMGIDAFLEHPISGWNLKELENYKKELAEKGVVSPEFIQYTHFHNQFIDDTAKKGLLGGISLLGVFLIPLYFFYKKQKNHKESKRIKFITTLGIIHILSIMSYCITQAFLAHNSGNIFYFFLLVVFWAFMKNESEE